MDEFELELRDFLQRRVATMPAEYGASPALVSRARRRRRTKRIALVVSVFVLASGTTAAVAEVARRPGKNQLVTTPDATTSSTVSTTTSTSATVTSTAPVPTVLSVACPVTYGVTSDTPLPPPSTAPRVVAGASAGAVAGLAYFAATTDPRFVALGPEGLTCEAIVGADGQDGFAIAATPGSAYNGQDSAPITVVNDYLWHGGVGSAVACSVFDDPALEAYLTTNYPQLLPCPKAGRTVTRVDANVATFEDVDGTVGVGIMVPPTRTPDTGKISVLTCRPSGVVTAAQCDTIVADFEARVRAELVTP